MCMCNMPMPALRGRKKKGEKIEKNNRPPHSRRELSLFVFSQEPVCGSSTSCLQRWTAWRVDGRSSSWLPLTDQVWRRTTITARLKELLGHGNPGCEASGSLFVC